MKVEAYQIAEVINLRKFRSDYTNSPIFANNSEIFYKQATDKFFYVLIFGVVIFAGFNDLEKSELLKFMKGYTEDDIAGEFKDDLTVKIDSSISLTVNYNSIVVNKLTDDALRIIMLNIGQSVALDYYEALSFEILNSTKKFIVELEATGNIKKSKVELLKFIGRTLNVKHSIIDNLYIFDAPDIVWESEYLEKLDEGLKKIFDLRMRYRDIDYRLKIVQENLTLFTELLQNRESNRLEWTVIILILIEVFHIFFNAVREFL
ncbi:MAG: RMD1 family protein [Verrucomicrobia bacterium]|nr:RMD1 family protein [Cytophagales bacterium]